MASRNRKFLELKNFSKGLVLNRPSFLLQEGEAEVAENVEVIDNVLRRRDGWTPLNSVALPSGASEPVTSLFSHYVSGTTPKLFAISGTRLMYSEGGDFTEVTSTLSPAGPTYGTFKATQNVLYIATKYGGMDTPQSLQKWTSGGGLVSVTSPAGWLVNSFAGTLFLAGDASPNDSRLYWSRLFPNQDTWPSNNFVDINPGDGDKITGMGRLLNALIVFKERSIHRVTGGPPDDAAVETGDMSVFSYEDQAGCIAPRSVASGYNRIVYLNRKGIFAYDGVKPVELSEPVRPLFESLNESELKNAVGFWANPFHYVLSVTTRNSSAPDLVFSVRLQPSLAITVWKGVSVSAFENFRIRGNTKLVIGEKGSVGKMEGETDNGKRIKWEYLTGALAFDNDPFHKTVRRGWLYSKPLRGDVNVEMLPEFADSGVSQIVPLGIATTKAEDVKRYKLSAFGTARNWSLRLSGQSDGPSPEVHSVLLEYFPISRG